MKIIEKFIQKQANLRACRQPAIAFLGDSVTQGCFEIYTVKGSLKVVFSPDDAYSEKLRKIFAILYPNVSLNVINAGIGGITAQDSLARMDKQVFAHDPDLVIVAFGLNDVNGELNAYMGALKQIFKRCQEYGTEVVFMTPNMLNTHVIEGTEERFVAYAHVTAEYQTKGRMDTYMYAAKALAEEMGVKVADCYSKWKELSKTQDTTLLLSNYINHPTREMHQLFAVTLFETVFEDGLEGQKETESTMYQK